MAKARAEAKAMASSRAMARARAKARARGRDLARARAKAIDEIPENCPNLVFRKGGLRASHQKGPYSLRSVLVCVGVCSNDIPNGCVVVIGVSFDR